MFSGKCMIQKKKERKKLKKKKRGGKKEWKPCDVQWSLEILKVKIYSLASKKMEDKTTRWSNLYVVISNYNWHGNINFVYFL